MYRWGKIYPESGQELWLVHMVVKLFKLLFSMLKTKLMVTKLKGGAHNLERANSILGLCHSVFTDQFIFRHILGNFSRENRISEMSMSEFEVEDIKKEN